MPARSKTQRKGILTSLYHFCHFNIGKDGKWNGMKLPNYEANIGTELREDVSTMGVEEWVEDANKAIESYNKTRKEEKETAEGKPTDPMDYPMAPLPPDYVGNLTQTAIDFDKERIADNIGQLILEVRRVAEALEILAECVTKPVYDSPYINIRKQP